VAVTRQVKRHATAMALGASAPLVVSFILAQRLGKKKVVIQARKLKRAVGPQFDRVAEERGRWKSDLTFGEVLEWALQSPVLNPRPKD
jgi:hypothetical protein